MERSPSAGIFRGGASKWSYFAPFLSGTSGNPVLSLVLELLQIRSHLGKKEVMPMIEGNKCMGRLVEVIRLSAGAAL